VSSSSLILGVETSTSQLAKHRRYSGLLPRTCSILGPSPFTDRLQLRLRSGILASSSGILTFIILLRPQTQSGSLLQVLATTRGRSLEPMLLIRHFHPDYNPSSLRCILGYQPSSKDGTGNIIKITIYNLTLVYLFTALREDYLTKIIPIYTSQRGWSYQLKYLYCLVWPVDLYIMQSIR
jgi:hypothetical protein